MEDKDRPVEDGAFRADREGAARILCAIAGVKSSLGYAFSLARMIEAGDWEFISLETRKRLLAKRDTVIALVEVMLE